MLRRCHILLKLLFVLLLSVSAHGAKFTVVIDAGHGGKDYGARGNLSCEKDVNLAVSLELGRLISQDRDVRVVYTRKTDVFVDLHHRANIANEIKADLYVSIHCNSMSEKTSWRESMKGAVTYVMGVNAIGDNLEVARRENSVVTMDEEFSTKYQMFDINSDESHVIFELNQRHRIQQSLDLAQEIQHNMVSIAGRSDAGVHQAGFTVLVQTSMPSVLVELDFISNPDCEKFMLSPEGQSKLAQAIYKAFLKYREKYRK